MSIERLERKGSVVWRVRWRDERGRNRSKVLGRKRDAEAFDAEVRRLKRTRDLGQLDAGKQALADFGAEWVVALRRAEPRAVNAEGLCGPVGPTCAPASCLLPAA